MVSRREILGQISHYIGSARPSLGSLDDLLRFGSSNPMSRRRFVEAAAVTGGAGLLYGCPDPFRPENDAPSWQQIPDIVVPMNTLRADIPARNLEDYARDIQTPSNQLTYELMGQSNPDLLQVALPGNRLVPASDLKRDDYGENLVTLIARDPQGLSATTTVRYVVNKEAYVTFNPRNIIGSLDSEPLIATPGTLILEKDGRRLDPVSVAGTTILQLGPGEYKVKYENPNYHDPWALMRQQGSDVNISQSDIANPWMTLNVGLEDRTVDIHKIPTNFPVMHGTDSTRSYFDIIFDNRNEPGITRWKPGLPLDIYIDTRAEVGGSGRVPSQQWVDAISQAAELLKQIKAIGGRQVFENINIYVRDANNPPPVGGTYGTVVVYSDDSSLNVGGNATVRDANGYVVAGTMHLRSWNDYVTDPLHELAQLIVDGFSQRDVDLSVNRTVYSRNSPPPNWMPVDLNANKIVHSFNQGTRFRA